MYTCGLNKPYRQRNGSVEGEMQAQEWHILERARKLQRSEGLHLDWCRCRRVHVRLCLCRVAQLLQLFHITDELGCPARELSQASQKYFIRPFEPNWDFSHTLRVSAAVSYPNVVQAVIENSTSHVECLPYGDACWSKHVFYPSCCSVLRHCSCLDELVSSF